MKVIIAGCRDIHCKHTVAKAIRESGFKVTEVVYGGCDGVDKIGKWMAERKSIPVEPFPADWTTHGLAAGPIRNRQMAEYADALVAVWDGKSKGTKSMISEAKKAGIKVYVLRVKSMDLKKIRGEKC